MSDIEGYISTCVNSASASPNVQQFTVSGSSLTDAANITAPTGFEVSLSQGSEYAASLSLIPSAGSISATTIFVRITAFSTPGLRTGNVTITSTGATTLQVAVSGQVYALPAMAPVTNKTFDHNMVTSIIPFTSTSGGSVFHWTNTNTSIGLPASGQGNIPSFTPVNPGIDPITASISVTPVSTSFAYVPSGDFVKVMNTESRDEVISIAVGSVPNGIAVSPDGTRVFVSNRDSDDVSVINVNTQAVITTIAVGDSPADLVVSANGSRVYVLNEEASTVSVINTSSNAVIANIPVTVSMPDKIVIHPSLNRVFVAGISEISEINTATNAQINTYAIGNSFTVITGMAINPISGKLYVSDGGFLQNIVYSFTTNAGLAVAGSIPTTAGPDGIVISPDGTKAYIAISESDAVAIADLSTNTVINSVAAGFAPEWVAVSPDGLYIYAQSNFFTGNVSVINALTQQPAGNLDVIANAGSGNFISPGTGCRGTPVTFTITINPILPTITVTRPTGSIVACRGEAAADPRIASIKVSGVNMRSGITITAPGSFEVSLSSTSGFGSSLTLPAGNNTVAETSVFIRTNASTIAGHPVAGIEVTATDALPKSFNISAWISAPPVVDPVEDREFVSGLETEDIFLTGNATAFDWTNSNPGIGLPASGSGSIPIFLAAGGEESPVNATITVTPKSVPLAYVPLNDDRSLVALDLNTRESVWTYALPDISFALAFSKDGKYVYSASINQLNIINTQTRRNEKTLEVSGNGVAMVLSNDGSKLYIANRIEDNITIVNTATQTIMQVIDLETEPTSLALSRDGLSLYVSYFSSNIDVISTSGNSIVGSIPAVSSVWQLRFNAERTLLYAAQATTISVIDPLLEQVVATIPVSNTRHLSLSPDDHYLFVTRSGTNGVVVVDAFNNTVIKTIDTGIEPSAVSVSRDGLNAYVFNFNSSSMSVISTASLTVSHTVPLGSRPYGTPEFIIDGAGCTGVPETFTITIKPPPPTIIVSKTTGLIESCEGVVSVAPEVQQFLVSGLQLTSTLLVTAPAGFEVSASPVSGYGASLSLTPVDGELTLVPVYVRASVSATPGDNHGEVQLSSTGAENAIAQVRSIIHATPVLNAPQHVSFVHGETTTAIPFSGTGTLSYSWTNNAPGIGLPASGSGTINSFTANNPGTVPVIASVTVSARTTVYAYLAKNDPSNHVSVVNTETGIVEKVIPLASDGIRVAAAPDGRHVYIGMRDKTITVISTETNTVVSTINVGDAVTRLVVSADSKKLYAVLYKQTILCIDTETNTIINSYSGSGDNLEIELDESNGTMYRSYYTSDFHEPWQFSLYIYKSDLISDEILKFKHILMDYPAIPSIEVSPDGQRSYVISGMKEITVLNADLEIVGQVDLSMTTNGNMELSRSGEYLYVADAGGNFHKINTATLQVEDILDVPGDWTIDMFDLNRNKLYTVHGSGMGRLSVFDANNGALIREIPAGEFPAAIGSFITRSSGCESEAQTFTITVYPEDHPLPVITPSAISGIVKTCVDQLSSNQSFTVIAESLTENLIIKAPDKFEIATAASGPFLDELSLSPVSGSVNTMVYVRLHAQETYGYWTADITLTSTGANPKMVTASAHVLTEPTLASETLISGTVGQAYNQTLPGRQSNITYSSEDLPAGLSISTAGVITGTPLASGTDFQFFVTADNGFCSTQTVFFITIHKQIATITLANTSHIFDGNPKGIVAVTEPPGLPVTITYNGSVDQPSAVSVYSVQAIINSTDYQGSKSGFMTIAKATAIVSITQTAQTYNGLSRPVTITTIPAGLPVIIRYNNLIAVPINAGTYPVQVTVNSPNYQGSANQTLNVAKVPLTITANDQTRVYGENNPALTLNYSGFVNGETSTVLDQLPIASTTATSSSNAGNYEITVSGGSDNNYAFNRQSGTLTVEKMDQTINFAPVSDMLSDAAPFQLVATASSGLPVIFSIVSGPAILADGTMVSLTGDGGEVVLRAFQSGSINVNPATEDQEFTVEVVLGEEPGYASMVKLYPNPATDKAVISIPAELVHSKFELINVQGIVVLSENFSGRDRIEIVLQTLSRGVYLVRIKSKNGLATRKLVVR